ncbi:hypothetical protein [Streptomyces sp. NPDC058572]|uniref:hypothetical protein n=1 Tax=Streptomyces sp. NPDC058572 TaxID=3346546 RepID=UPI003664D9DD
MLLRLLRTGDRDLCRTLAWRRELPEEVGDELVGHSDPDSACSAAANPMLPADDMRMVLDRAGIPA